MLTKLVKRARHIIRKYSRLYKWSKGPILSGDKFGVRRSATFRDAQLAPFVYEKVDDPVHGARLQDKTWDATIRSWV
jgi:hypothetical protein